MKKTIIAICLTTILSLTLVGCTSSTKSVEETYQEQIAALDKDIYLHQEYDNIIPISVDEAKKKKENGETFILYHGRNDCRFCKHIYPELSNQLQDDEVAYYVNLSYFIALKPDDETSELFKLNDQEYKNYLQYWGIEGAPNLLYVKDGQIVYQTSKLLVADYFREDVTDVEREQMLQLMAGNINEFLSITREDKNDSSSQTTVVK